jgi:urea transport system substrate-binding protein
LEFKAPEGTVKIEGENQHIWKPVRIGEVQGDGMIKEIWSTGESVRPDPFLKTYDWAKGLSD